MSATIQIKGIREGLLITLGDGPWEEARLALLEHLDQQAQFLRGARIALDVGNQVLKVVDLAALRNEIFDRQVSLWAVLSNSPTTVQTAQTLGMATRIGKPRPDLTIAHPETNLHGGEAAILVRRTLRSGFSLEHEGHIVIVGDVNPGAQVISNGDVIVWGRLRGMVHAGANGEKTAMICALELAPTQLRICDYIAQSQGRRGKPQPERAMISEDRIVIEPWEPKHR